MPLQAYLFTHGGTFFLLLTYFTSSLADLSDHAEDVQS